MHLLSVLLGAHRRHENTDSAYFMGLMVKDHIQAMLCLEVEVSEEVGNGNICNTSRIKIEKKKRKNICQDTSKMKK